MPGIFRRFLHAVRSLGISEKGSYAVAVSGGSDSTALLSLLVQLAKTTDITLTAVHVHHHTRGAESDADAAFVKELSQRLGCGFIQLDIQADSPDPNEEELRNLRYHALETCIAEHNFDGCFTGHTADDQAETVLMRILDGTGLRGLSGIPRQRGPFVRPLLSFFGQELKDHLAEQNIAFRFDSSNEDRRYRRNALRHDILPHLETVEERNIRKGLLMTSAIAADADAALRSLLPPAEFLTEAGDAYSVSRLRELSEQARGFAIKFILEDRWPGPPPRIPLVQRLQEIIASPNPQATAPLGDGREARRVYDALYLHDEARQRVPGTHPWDDMVIDSPGEYAFPGGIVTVTIDTKQAAEPDALSFSTDRAFPFVLRMRQPGDRIPETETMASRSLKKALINAKIPHQVRDVLPVIEHDGVILWVPGICKTHATASPSVFFTFTPADIYREFLPFKDT